MSSIQPAFVVRHLSVACLSLAFASACAVDDGPTSTSSAGISGISQGETGPGGDEDPSTSNGDGDGDPSTGNPTTTSNGDGDGDGDSDTTTDGSGTKFDLAGIPDAGAGSCAVPSHNPCDANNNDPWSALGINCPGEYALTTQYTGDPQAVYVHTGQLGSYNPPVYPTLEGSKMVILSSGIAQQLTIPGQYASTSHVGQDPLNLPAPMNPNSVDPGGNVDCSIDPNLVGTGDCSNTIQEQWSQGNGAYDYAELRISGQVPGGASGFSYNLAFFSTEYPGFYKTSFNDMYIAWLESEGWTGNVSFDEMGAPISLNAGFLDYKDAPNPYDCPAPCTAPQLQGTAMQGHAGTKWLTTTAGVTPGEDFELILAIFDLSDNILDSVVILDNFAWNCDGGPPVTVPG